MLSTAAFNALLKIIEEPPAHLLFILATTELHKVPATILSRCQRFSFRRLMQEDIASRINYVAYQEHIEIEPDAVQLLARLADGALRERLPRREASRRSWWTARWALPENGRPRKFLRRSRTRTHHAHWSCFPGFTPPERTLRP